jgi:hypothetical protein
MLKTSYSQDESGIVIKTNILPTIWGQIPFTGEYRIIYEQAVPSSPHSASIGLSLNTIPFLLSGVDAIQDLKVSGARIQLQYKLYLSKNNYAPMGFYIGPHFSYNTARFRDKNNPTDYVDLVFMNINGMIGYQVITSGRFVLDIFSGLGYKINSLNIVTNSGSSLIDESDVPVGVGPKFSFGFNFGYAF